MFDIQATIRWVTAVLKNPADAAADYRAAQPPWLQTFVQVVLPVYAIGLVLGYLIALVTGGALAYGGTSFGLLLFVLIWSLAWTFVVAFVFDLLAGTFDGQRDFDAAYALVGLAVVPAALGNAIAPVPLLGWLVSLAAGIYSIVLAYRFVPTFLSVPEANRVKHFVLAILVALVVNLVVGATIGAMLLPAAAPSYTTGTADEGLFGGVGRQASLAEAAAQDTYDPPGDGKVTKRQMENYVDVLEKTHTLRERLSAKFENMEEDEASVTDILGGMGDAMRLGTAEMEVVKTRGGNWAEHVWVKNQIETARVQQDLDDAVKHNYALFQRYQDRIEQFE